MVAHQPRDRQKAGMTATLLVLIAFAAVCFAVFGGKGFVRRHRVTMVALVVLLLGQQGCTSTPTHLGSDRFWIGWASDQPTEPAAPRAP